MNNEDDNENDKIERSTLDNQEEDNGKNIKDGKKEKNENGFTNEGKSDKLKDKKKKRNA